MTICTAAREAKAVLPFDSDLSRLDELGVLLHHFTVTLVHELQQLVEAASNVSSVAVEHRSVSGHDAVGVVEHDHLSLKVSSGHGGIVLDVSCSDMAREKRKQKERTRELTTTDVLP